MSASPSLKKFGECLYRNPPSRTYFARVKHRSKEIKQSVKTNNLPVARRKLKDFKTKLDRRNPAADRISLCSRTRRTLGELLRPLCTSGSETVLPCYRLRQRAHIEMRQEL